MTREPNPTVKDWSYWNQDEVDYVGWDDCPECGFHYFVARREGDKRNITKGRVVVPTPRGWMCVCCYFEWNWNGPLNEEKERKMAIDKVRKRAKGLRVHPQTMGRKK